MIWPDRVDAWVDGACAAVARLVPYAPIADPSVSFLHRALVGMLLIAPLCSTIGIQVVNFRLAFFAEAVGHSAFTGLALGLLASLLVGPDWMGPELAMVGFGVAIAIAITAYRRASGLSADTVIGVFSSAVIALGLFLIGHLSETRKLGGGDRKLLNFLQGNILVLEPRDIVVLAGLFALVMAFQAFSYNRLLFISINDSLAQSMRIRVRVYEYFFAAVLALVVMFSIQAVGALLVTAMLVIPAAAARTLARSAGGLFWWGLAIAASSAVGGLVASDYFSTATGATTVLCATAWFIAGGAVRRLAKWD